MKKFFNVLFVLLLFLTGCSVKKQATFKTGDVVKETDLNQLSEKELIEELKERGFTFSEDDYQVVAIVISDSLNDILNGSPSSVVDIANPTDNKHLGYTIYCTNKSGELFLVISVLGDIFSMDNIIENDFVIASFFIDNNDNDERQLKIYSLDEYINRMDTLYKEYGGFDSSRVHVVDKITVDNLKTLINSLQQQ